MNKDTSYVNFKNFHEDENSLYPSVSLCFLDEIFVEGFEAECYQHFLSGGEQNKQCTWNSSFADTDYDYVTINLVDYVIGEITTFEDKIRYWYVYRNVSGSNAKTNDKCAKIMDCNGGTRVYTSRRRWDKKCVTFDIPYRENKKVKYHAILLNNSVFEYKKRPKYGFQVFFHYPKQIMRQTSKKYVWSEDKHLLNQSCEDDDGDDDCPPYYNSTYTMMFDVDNVGVLKRRNKGHEPCIQNWKNDDTEIKSMISKKLQCQPNHWKLYLNITKCNTKEEMKNSFSMEESPSTPSCYSIGKQTFFYNEGAGLGKFTIDTKKIVDIFGVDWEATDIKNEVVSEILINFVGKRPRKYEISAVS